MFLPQLQIDSQIVSQRNSQSPSGDQNRHCPTHQNPFGRVHGLLLVDNFTVRIVIGLQTAADGIRVVLRALDGPKVVQDIVAAGYVVSSRCILL